jgi:hypothetical protein
LSSACTYSIFSRFQWKFELEAYLPEAKSEKLMNLSSGICEWQSDDLTCCRNRWGIVLSKKKPVKLLRDNANKLKSFDSLIVTLFSLPFRKSVAWTVTLFVGGRNCRHWIQLNSRFQSLLGDLIWTQNWPCIM